MVPIGGGVQEHPEKGFSLIRSTRGLRDLFGSHGLCPVGAEYGEGLVLEIQDTGGGPLSGLDPGLVIGVDTDQGCVEADRALEQCDEGAD